MVGMSGYVALIASLAAGLSSSVAEARTIVVQKSDCLALVRHMPKDGVNYQPGVDVRGRPVVSADAGTPSMRLPETIELVIGIDIADRLGGRNNAQARPLLPYEGKSILGVLSIDGNNVLWNGEPVDRETQAGLTEACQVAMKSNSGDKTGADSLP